MEQNHWSQCEVEVFAQVEPPFSGSFKKNYILIVLLWNK